MELRICCDASVKLDKLINVNNVDYEVEDYSIDNDTLNGKLRISGQYIKDDLETEYNFSEQVPFTVVFKNNNFKINDIRIEDFDFNQIINNGIDSSFKILIDYQLTDKSTNKLEAIDENISVDATDKKLSDKELEMVEEIIENSHAKNEENAVVEEANEDSNKEVDYDQLLITDVDEKVDYNENEKIKENINEKYDNLLKSILEGRNDNFLEEDKVTFVNQVDRGLRSVLAKIPETHQSYKVFYPNKESEIESICKKEKVSIDKVYNDNRNNDFLNKKRIIIK